MMPPEHESTRRRALRAGGAVSVLATAGCVGILDRDTADGDEFEIETVAEGLRHPWALAFLPETPRILVTERTGRLALLDRDDGTVESVDGTPEVHTRGQGGLLDVALHPDFPDAPWVYLTYSATNDDDESSTHLGRGRLDPEAPRLAEFELLYAAEPFVGSNVHYGSRAVFGADDLLYVTIGDRGSKDFGPDHVSQDRSTDLGTTVRLAPDGSIPDENPFVDAPEMRDAIFSYGHRNAQGMTIHPETGAIWQSEHGEQDGDEINVIERGGNYGWPIAHYGCTYGAGDSIGDEPHEREDVVDPVYFWECGERSHTTEGFPPAGMAFYDGDAFPEWQGDLFVGGLASEYLARFTVEDEDLDSVEVEEEGPLLVDRGWRIRDVGVAPDTGHLYVTVDAGEAPIVRLVPA